MKLRYKLAALFFSIFFLVFLPHTNLLNSVQGSFTEKTVLEKTAKVELPAPKKEEPAKDHSAARTKLLSDLQDTLGIHESFAVSIYDINNMEGFGINETQSLHAASVMKLLVATAALEAVESGKYSLKTPLAGQTLGWQLQQMINQSNNNSWDAFNRLLGFKKEQTVSDSLGLTGVVVKKNYMSTKGVAELLLKLYKGEVLTTEHRDLLFSYMQDTETENRISTGIPDGVSFYHKTGSLNGEVHDAAVVINPNDPFILVIFTDDTTGLPWSQRFAAFKKATQATYDYFSSI